MDHNKLWKILKEMGMAGHLTYLLRNLYGGAKKQKLEPDIEELTASGLRRECGKAVYCHPVYLTYMQSTSCKMLSWMSYKLDSRLPGNYQQPQICR